MPRYMRRYYGAVARVRAMLRSGAVAVKRYMLLLRAECRSPDSTTDAAACASLRQYFRLPRLRRHAIC